MKVSFSSFDTPSRVYTVAALNREARALLESGFSGISLEAEVVEMKRAASGHVYFTLADPGGKAQVSAVMWRGQAMRYGARLAVGAAVRCLGRVTLYEARGAYQVVVDSVEKAGAGTKAELLEALRKKLQLEGLFDAARKRPLPPFPACIGVVTSRSGAAFHDIVKVVSRRFPLRVVLSHAEVQGEGAPEALVRALERFSQVPSVDVVIVGRGGGSSEDLDAFNAEVVVRQVAGHPTPVISAVGHEVDTTLVDLVADRRAATPSEAAELAVPDGRALMERLAQGVDDLTGVMTGILEGRSNRVALLEGRVLTRDPRVRLRMGVETLARTQESLKRWPALAMAGARAGIAQRSAALERWPDAALSRYEAELVRLTSRLDALSPLASLARGYAVVRRRADKVIVRSHDQAPPGTEVEVTLSEGRLVCSVTRTDPRREGSS
jgi:exodeoxyribonuclease VII large subunit